MSDDTESNELENEAEDQSEATQNFDDISEDDLTEELIEAAKSVGINLPRQFLWDINAHDVLYLLNRCPYLQIVDTKVSVTEPEEEPRIILAESGWNIYDYGNALSTSPGLLLFAGGNFKIPVEDDDDSGDGGGIVNPGKGTIFNQAFTTALEMIRIADERLWEGLLIVDGHPLMQWAAWAEAYDRGFVVEGYTPTEKDYAKRQRIRRTEQEVIELRESLRLRAG
jgi:hypothetical protein